MDGTTHTFTNDSDILQRRFNRDKGYTVFLTWGSIFIPSNQRVKLPDNQLCWGILCFPSAFATWSLQLEQL